MREVVKLDPAAVGAGRTNAHMTPSSTTAPKCSR